MKQLDESFRAVSALLILPALFFAGIAATLEAAELVVPRLELATFGAVGEDGGFALSSVAAAEIALQGGYKYGGLLKLDFTSAELEKALGYSRTDVAPISADPTAADYNTLVDRVNNQSALGFKLAQVTARRPFDWPVELSYFIGTADTICSGDDFADRFGTVPVGTSFKGFAYFPEGIGGNPAYQYDGLYTVSGSGLSLSVDAGDFLAPMLYLYQDAAFIDQATGIPAVGRYSGDLRLLLNTENVKIEAFAGATLPYGSLGMYRGGALAFFTTGTGADFLAQVGVPAWSADADFSIDDLFFLFEPQLDFGPLAINITLFYHPVWYLQQENPDEQGATDVNVKLLVGDVMRNRLEGGLESTISLRASGETGFSLTVAPFVSVVTEGVRWDFKVRADPLAYTTPLEMFESYIGVRTAY